MLSHHFLTSSDQGLGCKANSCIVMLLSIDDFCVLECPFVILKGFSMSLLCISDVAHGTPDLPTPFIISMRVSVCRVSSIRTPTSFCHLPQELSHVLHVSALVLLLPLHLPSQRCALLMLEEAFNPNTQVDLVNDICLSENFLIFWRWRRCGRRAAVPPRFTQDPPHRQGLVKLQRGFGERSRLITV